MSASANRWEARAGTAVISRFARPQDPARPAAFCSPNRV